MDDYEWAMRLRGHTYVTASPPLWALKLWTFEELLLGRPVPHPNCRCTLEPVL